MVTYCKGDVELLEKIYNKMSSYFPHKTHLGVTEGKEKTSCPGCASTNMAYSRKRISTLGTFRIQLQCKDCGKYHTVSNRAYEQMVTEQLERDAWL